MIPADAMLRGSVRHWIELETGRAGDESTGAAHAVIQVYRKMESRIGTVIGNRGVEALFARSLKMVKKEFSLEIEMGVESAEGYADSVARWFKQDPERAPQMAEAVFAVFLGLLVSLIGTRLTFVLLGEIWPPKIWPQNGGGGVALPEEGS